MTTPDTAAKLRALRPAPERVVPIRHSAATLRHPEPGQTVLREPGEPRREGDTAMSSTEDVVVHAVRLGYKVAEEQVRKGRNAARRMRRASMASGAGDVGEMVAYGLRFYRQFSQLVVEAAETMGSGSRLWSQLKGARTADGAATRAGRGTTRHDLDAILAHIAGMLSGQQSGGFADGAADGEVERSIAELLRTHGPKLLASLLSPPAGGTASAPVPSGTGGSWSFNVNASGLRGKCRCSVPDHVNGQLRCPRLADSEDVALDAIVAFDAGHRSIDIDVKDTDAKAGVYCGVVLDGSEAVGFLSITLTARER